MLTTIIKHIPGGGRGKMRAYSITTVANGRRSTLDVLAMNGRAAIDLVRAASGNQKREVA
jgi:hypothetical protein